MKIAICDDEKYICDMLRDLVLREDPDADIYICRSADELLACDVNYHILYLDIQMPGINGITAAAALRKRCPDLCIIFVTALKDYVFDAFDVAAFHYLLKPVDAEKFAIVYKKAKKECMNKLPPSPVIIKTRHESCAIAPGDILYIESQIKKQVFHLTSGDITCYGKLSEYQEKLGSSFYRCHRSYLVNMAYIKAYSADEIHLTDGKTVYMAKERYADFRKSYLHYLKNGGAFHA